MVAIDFFYSSVCVEENRSISSLRKECE